MPTLVPVKGIMVHRDGKSVMAPIGEPFEFSDAEINDIPEGFAREPIVEQAAAPAPAPAPSGKKAAKTEDL